MSNVDYAQVAGLHSARRAAEIAAAGGHNILLVGPADSGKTLLARCMPGSMPPLGPDEVTELEAIYADTKWRAPSVRPFRAPHSSASEVGMFGGGTPVLPGEISLAHAGVLFVDDAHEFKQATLARVSTLLRQGEVRIVRRGIESVFPTRPLLVLGVPPCPCGYRGSKSLVCACGPMRLARHFAGVRAALPAIYIAAPLGWLDAGQYTRGESIETVRLRVTAARER